MSRGKNSKYIPAILLLTLYGLTPLLWFNKGTMIAGGETVTYLNMDYVASKDIMTWNDKMSSNNGEAGQIVFYRPWLLLRELGFSKETSQRVLTVASFFLIPFSMFYLFRSLKISSKYSVIGALIASTLYTYNLFGVLMSQGHLLRYFHSFFPLIAGLYLRGLDNTNFSEKIKYSVYIALCFLGVGVASANPSIIASIIIVCLLLTAFHMDRNNYKLQIKFIMGTILITLMLNYYWLSSTYMYFSNILATSGSGDNAARWNSLSEGKLYESFRLLGSWAFKNEIYFPWHPYYYGKSIYITIFSYLIPILAFSALLLKPTKKIIVFAILAVFSLFLVKGTNFPFGFLYAYFYDNFNWAYAFRSPWAKFNSITMLSYSVLLGYSCCQIYNYLKKYNKLLPYCFASWIILSLGITSFPLLTGDVVQTTVYRTMHSKEPQYWEQLAKWFENNDPDERVMSLPNVNYSSIYNWEHGITSSRPIAEYLIPNPHVHWTEDHFATFPIQKNANIPYSYFTDRIVFNSSLDLLSIKYILQQNDIDYMHPALLSHNIFGRTFVKSNLLNNTKISHIGQFGKLDLYRVNQNMDVVVGW